MKGWVVYSLVVSVIAVGAIGVAAGFAISKATDNSDPKIEATVTTVPTARPTATPTAAPTEYVPRLTGSEAASKAKDMLYNAASTDQERSAILALVCESEDFNKTDRAWIVGCAAFGITSRFKVYDSTGAVELLH
jgi:hypothetical protein